MIRMDFTMDAQSFADLNIFEGNKDSFSVYEIFKKTRTIGGRERVEQLMKSPSNNLKLLVDRRNAVEYFVQSHLELDISNDRFDLMLHYINYDKGRIRSNPLDSFLAFLKSQISPNQDYYVVQVGLKHLLNFFRYAQLLSSELVKVNAPDLLLKIALRIKEIIEDLNLLIPEKSTKKALNFYQIGQLDNKIRITHKTKVIELISLFHELDAFESIARNSVEKNYCLPDYITKEEGLNLQIKGLFHPAIENAIPNDLDIDDSNALIFLTGSNMAGKSSLLKSLGIVIYLSHLGFPVPAKSMRTIVFNGLLTTINLSDNIENGLSHYFSEVKRVKTVANTLILSNRMFIILDELFKGTNSKDAYDASLLVINGFAKIKDSVFIVSSHITELASELIKDNKVNFMCLEHRVINHKPHFTYTLKDGVEKEGIGMYFIHQENILPLVAQAIHRKNETE